MHNKKSSAPPPAAEKLASEESADDRNEARRLDSVFISKVISATMLGEEWVRSMFRDFTSQVMNQVRDFRLCLLQVGKAKSRRVASGT